MEILKFKLSGKTAFFKKPEVNTYYYFTYGQIHKAAILGIFGAILGYAGYGNVWMDKVDRKLFQPCLCQGQEQMASGLWHGNQNGNIFFGKDRELPEYYRKLKNVKIGIVPCNKNGYIPKKIQTFNNSVGYASREQGGNLVVKEQWLEAPEWDIYILIDNEESEKLKHAIQKRSAIYLPYLGKNDHPADISEISVCHGERIEIEKNSPVEISSMFVKRYTVLDMDNEDMEIQVFKYEESLPTGLEEESLLYQMEKLIYTNLPVVSYEGELYQIVEDKKKIAFM